MGKPQDGRRLLGSTGVLMIPIPAGGRLTGIDGIDEVSALPHVTGVEITVPVGSRIRPVPEADRYPFLRNEMRFIGRCLRAEVPVLGASA